MTGPAILVVGDATARARDTLEILEHVGYRLDFARNLDEATSCLSGDVDLLVVDDDSGAAGGELLRGLRASGTGGSVPALHLAGTFAGKIAAASVAGTRARGPEDFHLTLPAERPVLLSMVRAILMARQAQRQRDHHVSTLAHDLRTPLNSIMGWADILMRQPREMDFTQGLQSIERNARAQAQLISDVLDLSRMSNGALVLEMAKTDPASILPGALKGIADACKARQIEIQTDVAEPLPRVLADSERLQQIVGNLLANAVKVAPKSSIVRMEVARSGPGQLRITVIDRGRGIAPELLADVAMSWREGRDSRNRGASQNLDLAITDGLVALHGGTLSVHSDGTGKGSSYTVLLPTVSDS